jgi:hypothetical protein
MRGTGMFQPGSLGVINNTLEEEQTMILGYARNLMILEKSYLRTFLGRLK